MWSPQDLREGAAHLLDLEHATEDHLIAYMAAVLRLSESSRSDSGQNWEVLRTFLVLVSAIAESEGVMVTPETSEALGRRAISVLSEAIASAHRQAQGLPPADGDGQS
ncbi:MAG TPA: hypothetical protein VHV57_11005 [Acidimicrobiales bacterium]|nr:hypothetical protein [Acidimicrobiales bacterium]